MNRKEELEKTLLETREELRKIEDEEKKIINRQYVGKFLKAHNCYSCPEPDEYWWYYVAIINMDNNGCLESWSFQKDIYGKIEVEKDSVFHDTGGFIEISKEEFQEAFTSLLAELNNLLNTI